MSIDRTRTLHVISAHPKRVAETQLQAVPMRSKP